MPKDTNKTRENFAPLIAPAKFAADGYCGKPEFLTARQCEFYLSLVENYRISHDVPQIRRESGNRSLNYRVIDGLKIKKYLSEIQALYFEVNRIVNRTVGENLAPFKNEQVGVNVNITPPNRRKRKANRKEIWKARKNQSSPSRAPTKNTVRRKEFCKSSAWRLSFWAE